MTDVTDKVRAALERACIWDIEGAEYYREALSLLKGHVIVPVEPTRGMLNAAVDVDSYKLGDISPLGFRISPQRLFEKCYAAMIAPYVEGE